MQAHYLQNTCVFNDLIIFFILGYSKKLPIFYKRNKLKIWSNSGSLRSYSSMRNRIKNGIFSTPDAICLIKILLTIDLCNRHEHLLDFREGSLREIPTARSLPRRWFKPIIRSFEHEVSFAKQSRANVTAKLHSLKHEGAIVFRDFKNDYGYFSQSGKEIYTFNIAAALWCINLHSTMICITWLRKSCKQRLV